MLSTHILGFPRVGRRRELKFALEAYWRSEQTEAELLATAKALRRQHWSWQKAAGLRFINVGDFSLYDQVLDTAVLLGALSRRFPFDARQLTLQQYFELARGNNAQPALEMTKWFDTNYHYLKPELDVDSRFDGGQRWLFEQVAEARGEAHPIKVQLIGPLTFLRLARVQNIDPLALLPRLIPAYGRILAELKQLGVAWVQMDEPILALDLPQDWQAALGPVYRELAANAPQLLLATYFGSVSAHAGLIASLPLQGVHIDLIRAPEQLSDFLAVWPDDKILSLGIIDGRNVWKRDPDEALSQIARAQRQRNEPIWLAPSCSLLHVPVDLEQESELEPALRGGLSFARQKLEELQLLQRTASLGRSVNFQALEQHRKERAAWQQHSGRTRSDVASRLRHLPAAERHLPYQQRAPLQAARLQLPQLPTTTIGSFPQTSNIRQARAALRRGELDQAAYEQAMQAEIALAVRKQEALGLDLLVHGEAERNDMVEYFSSQLDGFAATEFGWVQSYGSRCVKPPLIWGDVARPAAMTVNWTRYAQSLTQRPMKGMLTGPVTLLQWSFVRDDIPRSTVALQLALALRDEVRDLQEAGIAAIQIDEPAFREGLPLKASDWQAYLDWAVQAFRIAASVANDDTQIHTHMCYSEFEDILPAIAALDADVITIETARSDMTLLDAFADFAYPNEIGPGIYDIHSPRVPSTDAMVRLLEKALAVVPPERLWVNPDCGLKTRGWAETEAALAQMVAAAKALRAKCAVKAEALASA